MREINDKGFKLIKDFEGCSLESYLCPAGVWTIGYGHTGPEVVKGMKYTQQQADMQLQKDLYKFYHLDDYLSEKVNENQYSALVCLAFNIGLAALKMSRVLRAVNNGVNPDTEWMQWNHIHGVVSNGLTRRRKAELELYHELS